MSCPGHGRAPGLFALSWHPSYIVYETLREKGGGQGSGRFGASIQTKTLVGKFELHLKMMEKGQRWAGAS